MRLLSKISLILVLAGFTGFYGYADRGGLAKKKREAISLNISTKSGFKQSLDFNLANGLKYKGTLLNSSAPARVSTKDAYVFQKGNMVYVMPYKSKIVTVDAKPGYGGVKLTLKVP